MKYTINFKVFGVPEGDLLDGNEPDNPLVLEMDDGDEAGTPIEEAVRGMKPGETKSVEVDAEDSVGPWDESRVERIPVSQFADGTEFETGGLYAFGEEDEDEVYFRVVGREDDVLVCDFNHPLAGRRLRFEISLLAVG